MRKQMRFLILTLTLLASQANAITFLGPEKQEPTIPISSWYWDINQPGIGLSINIQKSKHVPSGYLVFGAFFTYKEDGSQAWYTTQGNYEPNLNGWKETPDFFTDGEESYMGKLTSALYETRDGTAIDVGGYKENSISEYKAVELVWLTPRKIEIYIDSESDPRHTFEVQEFYEDPAGDFDFIQERYWQITGARYAFDSTSTRTGLVRYNSVVKFDKFVPEELFSNMPDPSVMTLFNYDVDRNERQEFYISSRPIGFISGGINEFGTMDFYIKHEGGDHYFVMVYDQQTQIVDFYDMTTIDNDDPTTGLVAFMGDYKFRSYLVAPDQDSINLYPAECFHCGGQGSYRSDVVRRSAVHMFELPDIGETLSRLPDVYTAAPLLYEPQD